MLERIIIVFPAIGGVLFFTLPGGAVLFPVGVALGAGIKHLIKSKAITKLTQKAKSAVKLNILG